MGNVRIKHRASGTVLADGPIGWGITPFEGNFYIRKKFLKTKGFKVNFIPGLCPYKFLYVWMYWLPNPLFPFIWFRVGVPRHHPEIEIEEY